ncbi:hypothetical protein ACNQKP_07845 [Bdellovibrio bacteriovorus]|uniref:hypothetical protein n=1 Tax=Bdellovibrio bacteriovorus TaxID=959 RepID=UPI003AA7D23D
MPGLRLFILISVLWTASQAQADFSDCYLINECSQFRRDPASPAPGGSQIKINPSAVPTEKGLGLEAIYFNPSADFSIVRGNGKVGAALSPSNSEETFFGAPGFELMEDLWERKHNQQKYPNQKLTLASAFDIVDRKGNGYRRYSLKAGAMAKYNTETNKINIGGGINAIWGPFSAGYSVYGDETQLEQSEYVKTTIKYQVNTYNVALHLSSLILSYANLHLMEEEELYEARVQTFTASLAMGKFIFTAAKRIEDSPAWAYNYETKELEEKQIKEEYFGGVQYSLSRRFMIGALYNYYLLREGSVTATLFF